MQKNQLNQLDKIKSNTRNIRNMPFERAPPLPQAKDPPAIRVRTLKIEGAPEDLRQVLGRKPARNR